MTSGRDQGLVRTGGAWAEIEILDVTVNADKAEDIFWFMFEKAEIDAPGGGFIFGAYIYLLTYTPGTPMLVR